MAGRELLTHWLVVRYSFDLDIDNIVENKEKIYIYNSEQNFKFDFFWKAVFSVYLFVHSSS